MTAPTPEVDLNSLEEFRQRLEERARHPRRLIALAFLRQGIVAFVLLFLVLPLVMGHPLFGSTLTGRKALILGMAVMMMASSSAYFAYRSTRDTLSIGLDQHRRLLVEDWKRWTGIGWTRRTITAAGLITLGVGLPVGLLQALTMPVADLPSGSRVLMFLLFLGLTALWAFPMAFGIRWYVLRDYRGRGRGAGR